MFTRYYSIMRFSARLLEAGSFKSVRLPQNLQMRRFMCVDQCKVDIIKEIYDDSSEDDGGYVKLRDQYMHFDNTGHQVIVIQPFLRTLGTTTNTSKELMMLESKSLVKTLNWKVVDSVFVGLNSFKKKQLFGTGKLKEIHDLVAKNLKISAIFVSLYQLSASQRIFLEDTFELPVIDRYNLILQIFDQHARTREAKLQVALAEIPYIRNRLIAEHERELNSKHRKGNLGEEYFESRKFSLKKVQSKLSKKIEAIKVQRNKLRSSRGRLDIPSVAVVGYTNSGKTSLIKALTGDTLEPCDQLFATLDVTCHMGRLPSNLQCIFIDTVGFLSDIPTTLIASFNATLEDAVHADLILHVRDVSHPDSENQNDQVLACFQKLNFSCTEENTITVANKIDKVDLSVVKEMKGHHILPISATENLGLAQLAGAIDSRLHRLTGRQRMVYRVRTGGLEDEWLRKEATVVSSDVDADQNFSKVTVVISKEQMGRFHARFIRQ